VAPARPAEVPRRRRKLRRLGQRRSGAYPTKSYKYRFTNTCNYK
jgi:hypothetical protein